MSGRMEKVEEVFGLELKVAGFTVLFVVGLYAFFQLWLGSTMIVSSVVEIEKQYIQLIGFLLAFTGVTYASVFSQIHQKEAPSKYLFARLGFGAMGAFSYLFAALVLSSWTLVISLNLDQKGQYSTFAAFVAPLGLMAAAFMLILVGIWRLMLANTKNP
jgi:hypothetical protein